MAKQNDTDDATKPPAAAYEPTPRERAVLDRLRAYRDANPPAKLRKGQGGPARLAFEHSEPAVGMAMLLGSLGSCDLDFANPFLAQLANAASKGAELDEEATAFMLAVVRGLEPRDQIEALLAAQMAAVHVATMTAARRLAHVDTIQQQDSASAMFNKLARTFAAQTEALKRYRTGGAQTVTVQHVHVSEGGQAIVGNVSTGGRGAAGKPPETP